MEGIRLTIQEGDDDIVITISQHLKRRDSRYIWNKIKRVVITKVHNDSFIGKKIVDVVPFNLPLSNEYMEEKEKWARVFCIGYLWLWGF